MENKYTLATLQKGINVLNLFKTDAKLSFSDIQHRLKYNKSTLFRILYTLEQNHYLLRDVHGSYELGLEVYILGNQLSKVGRLEKFASVALQQLAEETGLTVHLGILDGLEVVIIGKYHPPSSALSMFSRIGSAVPAHCTGQGKVLLAYSPREKVERIINTQGLRRYTPTTLTTPRELFSELEIIRSQGYAVDRAEHEQHIYCVAMPLLDEMGQVEAAVSMTGLMMYFEDSTLIADKVKTLSRTINQIRRKMHFEQKQKGTHHV